MVMRDAFYLLSKYLCGRFFSENVHTCVNFMSYKIIKLSSLVDFHSLYKLLHSQVYRNGLKL